MMVSNVNPAVVKRFETLMKYKRLGHAYLFVGPQGIGKAETALAVAALAIDGDETTAKRIAAGNHPDVHVISKGEEESAISIDRIRDLIVRMQMKPFEAPCQVAVIKNVEELSTEAGNALLKTLEEPTPNSLLILTTAVPERNLGTIRSRCQTVYFFPLSKDKLAAQLKKDYAIEESATRFLTFFSEGNPGKARRLKETDFISRKNELIDNVLFERNSDAFLKDILTDKEQTKELLDVLLSWFRDVLLLKAGDIEENTVHADRIKDLRQASQRYSFEELESIIEQIVTTTQLLGDNLNVKIPVSLLRERIWVKSSR
jgi:DNA polymerase-3 subunit delta'